MNSDIGLIFPKSEHNHEIEVYQSDAFALKSKCRKIANSSRANLHEVLNDVTRYDTSAHKTTRSESLISSNERITTYNSKTAIQFCDQLPATNFAIHLKGIVLLGERIAVIFFSETIFEVLGDISDNQFDDTFMRHQDYFINCLLSLSQLEDTLSQVSIE